MKWLVVPPPGLQAEKYVVEGVLRLYYNVGERQGCVVIEEPSRAGVPSFTPQDVLAVIPKDWLVVPTEGNAEADASPAARVYDYSSGRECLDLPCGKDVWKIHKERLRALQRSVLCDLSYKIPSTDRQLIDGLISLVCQKMFTEKP